MEVGVKEDSRDDFAAVVQRKPDLNDPRHSSKWYFRNADEDKSSEYFYVVNKFSDKYLEVAEESKDEDAFFQQNAFTGKANQRFKFVPDRFAHCRIVAAHSDMVLTSTDNATKREARLVQRRATGEHGQRWRLEEVDCDPHPDQTYHIEERDGDSVLGVDPRKPTALQLISKIWVLHTKKFQFLQVGWALQGEGEVGDASGRNVVLYKISPDKDDNVLQAGEKGVALAAPDEKDDGKQRFCFVRKAKNHACEIKNYRFQKTLSVDPASGEVVMSEDRNHKGSQWRLIPARYELEITRDTPYRIRNRKSGYYMDVFRADGQANTSFGQNKQYFYFKKVGKQRQVYQIQVGSSSLVFDAKNEEAIEQVPSMQNDPWQMFKLIYLWQERDREVGKKKAQYASVVSVMTEKALAPAADTGYSVNVVQRPVNYSDTSQHWEIVKRE